MILVAPGVQGDAVRAVEPAAILAFEPGAVAAVGLEGADAFDGAELVFAAVARVGVATIVGGAADQGDALGVVAVGEAVALVVDAVEAVGLQAVQVAGAVRVQAIDEAVAGVVDAVRTDFESRAGQVTGDRILVSEVEVVGE